jgi:hypothetical protein
MTKYYGVSRENWPDRMTIVPKWRRLDDGGIDDMREWCKSVPRPTLQRIPVIWQHSLHVCNNGRIRAA